MGYTKEDLKTKLLEMYPEIKAFGLSLSLELDKEKDAWVVSFEKGNHRRYAFLDKKDADSCIGGNVCVYLGMLIAQYIKDMELLVSEKR
jgi:predicted membrane GTPase involved in stress response